jgi:RNA polymerase sigma-70 factor (ECF subfamily)
MWSLSDEALVAGFAAGEPDAAAAFVRRFQARVFGLALTMVGDMAVAEEISQEAFVRAWRHAPGYDSRRGRVTTWILAITRNLAIDHLRSKRPEPIDPEVSQRASAVWARVASDPEAAPGEDNAQIRDALSPLPPEQRRALLLASLFGYTASEVGEIEDIPTGTAKTRIRTALLKLSREDSAEPIAGDEARGGA